MGRIKVSYYSPLERTVQLERYHTLSEKQQRYFLGFEYKRLGVGSQHYLSEVFSCSRMRIRRGLKEIESGGLSSDNHRQRKVGGGRKKRSKPS